MYKNKTKLKKEIPKLEIKYKLLKNQKKTIFGAVDTKYEGD